MAIQEFEPQGEIHVPEFKIWPVFEDGDLYHYLTVDGQSLGVVDWEMEYDGAVGFIDGLDGEAELDARGIRDIAWVAIGDCMRVHYPKIEEIEHLDGTIYYY